MLPRFSVKKPYTVLVGVILIIVLGIVSYSNISADLMPDMNLPYTIVITPYQGASPEQVELAVSRPVESSMATISNINNVSSVSSQNMSIVILEFQESANMDSVTIEMREKLDQISSFWPDEIGNPTILKLNPEMISIMVAAVSSEDLDRAELTAFVNESILPEIESIEGVASVTVDGELEESIHVIIEDDKIAKVNKNIEDALNKAFDEAEEEIDKGEEEFLKGKDELENAKTIASEEMSKGKKALQDAQSEILKAEIEIDVGLAEIKSQEAQLTAIEEFLSQIQDVFIGLNDTNVELQELKQNLVNVKEEAKERQSYLEDPYVKDQIDSSSNLVDGIITEIRGILEEEYGPYIPEVRQVLENYDIQLLQVDESYSNLPDRTSLISRDGNSEAIIDSLIRGIDKISNFITSGNEEISTALTEIANNKVKLDQGAEVLKATKDKIASGKTSSSQALEELNKNEILASIELGAATGQLQSAELELEKAKEEFEVTKEEALDKAKLDNFITTDMIEGILIAQNFSMPAGYVTEEDVSYLVRVGDKFEDIEAISNLIIMDPDIEGIDPIKLSDIADIVTTDNSDQVYSVVNGEDGLLLQVQKQTGYATGDVSDDINARFKELESTHKGLQIMPLMDQGVYIDILIDSIYDSIITGGILAIIVLILFMKDIKPTFVVALSIPISLIGAITLMYFTGVSINVISLAGLALGVGMLIDNSIVVIENIYRMRSEGVHVKQAAIEGATQVAGAIIASTLTTVCVFLPIVFTEGITRELFADMGLTVAYSLIASLVVSLTVVPAMSAGMLRNVEEKENKLFDRVANSYSNLLSKVIDHKWITVILTVVVFVVSIFAAFSRGTALFPPMESPQIMINLETEENTPLQETAKISNQVIARISEIEDVDGIGAMTSSLAMIGIGTDDSESNSVSIYVRLVDDKELSNEELEELIVEKTQDIDVKLDIQTQTMDTSALGGTGIQVEVRGNDLDTLQEQAKNVASIISSVDGTRNISDGLQESTPEFRIVVDKEATINHNLTVAQVFNEINSVLRQGYPTTSLSTDTYDYGIVVSSDKNQILTRKDLENLDIKYTNLDGSQDSVKLSQIANFEDGQSPNSIMRNDGQRYIRVNAELERGHNIGLVGEDVERALEDYQMPDGFRYIVRGENESINDAFEQLSLMMVLAIIFIYLIMVAQFQSLLSPFIVMFTIPLAFTGGFLGLYITGREVSLIALIGFLLLAGIIVNNGIVLVDYINQLRLGGMEKKEAIITAARVRLKPILMTALTTILGLMPLAFGMGTGTEVIQPMGIAVVGGLIYGTLLTLFIIPCFYDLFNRKEEMVDRLAEIEDSEVK